MTTSANDNDEPDWTDSGADGAADGLNKTAASNDGGADGNADNPEGESEADGAA